MYKEYYKKSPIDEKILLKLQEEYKWLRLCSSEVKNYIPPHYYDSIIKPYSFNKLEDLDLLRNFLLKSEISNTNPANLDVLEIGCGSGRSTKVYFDVFGETSKLDATDLSEEMVSHTKERFSHMKNFNPIISDHIEYLASTGKQYDVIFSLWSLSHSIHQHIEKYGIHKGTAIVKNALENMCTKLLKDNGELFIIHFDTMSDEQKILVKQWGKYFEEFDILGKQSYSKKIVDEVLTSLSDANYVDLEIVHLKGDPIVYSSLNEAMEVFFNFHMETEFNRDSHLPELLGEVKSDLREFMVNDTVIIKPGCFIYRLKK